MFQVFSIQWNIVHLQTLQGRNCINSPPALLPDMPRVGETPEKSPSNTFLYLSKLYPGGEYKFSSGVGGATERKVIRWKLFLLIIII